MKDTITDQWRVYQEIIEALSTNTTPLRMFLQASAGTGKSFLLEAVYLWCSLNGHTPLACAPTGIAAARLNVPRTPVHAYTIHNLFALDIQLQSKIDPSRPEQEDTRRLSHMTVLIIDEVSMIDDACWLAIKDQLSTISSLHVSDVCGRGFAWPDALGRVHIILSGDFKQLPPATSNPPFIAADSKIFELFSFRVLRQNRRLAPAHDSQKQAELDQFHCTLEDIAMARHSSLVRKFLIEAYVRGAQRTQKNVNFEGSTACFTKRAYRNRWNKEVLARSAKAFQRSLKVKATFCARGTQGQWIRDSAAAAIRRVVRSQCLLNLRLAGQWLQDAPRLNSERPHCMRAMLVANLDVPHRFANGCLGRVTSWSPEYTSSRRAPVPAHHPDVGARFYHESSFQSGKKHFLPEVDFLDVVPRRETVVNARGQPTMLQIQLQPAYALTIHKIQALTLTQLVLGCLEGVFAHGQIYVLISRVTDPQNFCAIGMPPEDIWMMLLVPGMTQG